MQKTKYVLLTIALMMLSACATQEASDRDYLSGADGEAFGPGVFTGDTGALNLTEVFADEKRRRIGGATAYDVDLPAMDQKSFEEYERFKAWRRAQNPDSTDYKEFLEWQEYQKYRRFKQQQAQ